jgi:hypothetical protein
MSGPLGSPNGVRLPERRQKPPLPWAPRALQSGVYFVVLERLVWET